MFVQPVDTTALDYGAQSTASDTAGPAAMQDRFLKLLVAQLNNQDPMNPLDNAQMTTQMAQINTVTGLQTLNLTMQGIAEQISAMQALQGMTMIGRSVLCEGDKLAMEEGRGKGAFILPGAASDVTVEIVTAGGKILDTLKLGAQGQGQHSFTWDADKTTADVSNVHFRVVADGSEGRMTAVPLMYAKVAATGMDAGMLILTLENGNIMRYADIRGVV